MNRVVMVLLFLVAMVLLGVLVVQARAPEVVWRCYEEPVVYEEDGYWVVECESGNEIRDEGYPGPGEEPYPEPDPIETPGCIRAWDGEECWPSE